MSLRWIARAMAAATVVVLVVSGLWAGPARSQEPSPEPSPSATGDPAPEPSPSPTEGLEATPTASDPPAPSPDPVDPSEPAPGGTPVEDSPTSGPPSRVPTPRPTEVEREPGPAEAGGRRALQSSATVAAVDDAFSPATLTVTVGTTVVWTNRGQNPHTVTADDRAFDSGTLERGQTFSVTFERPGTVSYYCQIHGEPGSGMTGVVNVQAAPAPADPPSELPTGEPDALARTGLGLPLPPIVFGVAGLMVVGLGALRLGRRWAGGRG